VAGGDGHTVSLLGHPSWVGEVGGGAETLVLLHGGLLHTELLLNSFGVLLADDYRVVGADRIGHGRTADDGEPFTYESMAAQTIALLEHLGGAPKVLIGWSDGGVAALHAALARPELVKAMVLIGSTYHVSGSDNHGLAPDSEPYQWCKSEYAARSPDGEAHFDAVAERLFRLWRAEPQLTADDMARLTMPTLVMAGDRDSVTLEHVIDTYRALPDADLAIVPNAGHGLPFDRPRIVADLIRDFVGRLDAPGETGQAAG